LTDGTDKILATVDYTFTTEGMFVSNMTDFRDTGITLDAAAGLPGYNWLVAAADATDEAYDDTGNIIYGDGNTEGTTSADGTFEDNNKYVVLPGNGTDTYQDAIVGIQRTGWYDDSGGTDQWGWDENFESTYDVLVAQEKNHLTQGKHYSQWFLHLLAEDDLDTETEREGYINDFRNPDTLDFDTGSEWNDAPASPGLDFDGTDDYVETTYDSDITLLTISFWFKTSTYTRYAAFTGVRKETGANDAQIKITTDQGGGKECIITAFATDADGDSAGIDGEIEVDDNQWHHLAFTIASGGVVTTYIDGEVDVTDTNSSLGSIDLDGLTWPIGGYRNKTFGVQTPIDATIDDFRIYDTDLTQAQIQERMYKQLDSSDALWGNLVGYWRFNENTGSNAHDETTNNNDGTITNATWSSGFVPDQYNEAEGVYTVDASDNQIDLDIDGGTNLSTLLDGTAPAGGASITVDSTGSYPSSGFAYIEGDKFTYTGTGATTFIGIPSSGPSSVIGHADNSVVSLMNRHNPMYKIRKYYDNDKPSSVTMEGTSLTEGVDYNVDFKPFSDAYFADELTWASTLEAAGSITSPDVGSAGTHSAGDFVPGKYGNGFETDTDNENITYPSASNMLASTSVIEFWYRPNSAHTDDTRHYFVSSSYNPGSGIDFFQFFKESNTDSNRLIVKFYDGATTNNYGLYIESSNYSWNAGDWVHLRAEWDDNLSSDEFKLYVNGVAPTHTHYNDGSYDSSNISLATDIYVGTAASGSYSADGVIDEFRIYGGASTEPDDLAQGGNTSDGSEYLNRDDNDYTLDFEADDAQNRGEYLFLGSDSMFGGINFDFETEGVDSSADLNWQYWDGDSWVSLEGISDFTDGTSNLTQDGSVYWTANPTNWRPYSMNGSTDLYYIRAHLESGSYTTDPIENLIKTDILLFQYTRYDGDISSINQTLEIPGYTTNSPPIAYWAFDEGYGTTAEDRSNHNNPGTITNATWQTKDLCVSEKCLHFDGDGDYVSRSDDSELDFDENRSFTITGWVRHGPISTSPDLIVAKHESGTAGGYKVYMDSDGDIAFAIDDDGTWGPEDVVGDDQSKNYDDNKWHHFAAVKDDTTGIYLYVDGQQIDSDTSLTSLNSLANGASFYVGIDADGASNDFDGFIDEIKMYRYVRTTSEIQADFVRGATTKGSSASFSDDLSYLSEGLVGYWKMDESSDGSGAVTRVDSSGNGNDLTDNNTTASGAGKFGNGGDFENSASEDEHLSIINGSQTGLDITGNITIAGWYKFESINPPYGPTIASKTLEKTTDDSLGYVLQLEQGGSSGRVRFKTSSAGTSWDGVVTGSTWTSADEWHHIVGVYDGSYLRVYLDGSSDTTPVAYSDGIFDNSGDFMIGATDFESGTVCEFDGLIDDVRIYNRALTSSEVEKLYHWAPGPIAYYKFDEGSGTTSAYDSSGNDYTGTMNGSMTEDDWVPGKFGKALDFDGSDDDITHTNSNLIYDYPFTMMAWAKNTAGGDQVIVSVGSAAGTNCWHQISVENSTNIIKLWTNATGSNHQEPGTTDFDDGKWHHVAGVYQSPTEHNLYVDGVLEATETDTIEFQNCIEQISVGEKGSSETDAWVWDGPIDEVKIYNYARTQAQIIQDLNAGHPAPGSPVGSPIAHWKFDEGYGDTAYDSSSQDNDGDLYGSCPGAATCPTWSNDGKFSKALSFDGGDYVNIGTPTELNYLGQSDFSVSTWAKRNSSGSSHMIIGKENAAAVDGWHLHYESGDTLHFIVKSSVSSQAKSNETITDTNWHHVLGILENNTPKIFLDGKEVTYALQTDVDTPVDDSANNLSVGQAGDFTGQRFDGLIDEVKIYNFALTADQVKTEYNQGKAQVMGSVSVDSSK